MIDDIQGSGSYNYSCNKPDCIFCLMMGLKHFEYPITIKVKTVRLKTKLTFNQAMKPVFKNAGNGSRKSDY